MDLDTAELRREITRIKNSKQPGYPPELKRQLGDTIVQLREAGWTYTAIGEAVGLSGRSIRTWVERLQLDEADHEMRPVVLDDPVTTSMPSTLTLTSPGGWRLEGLTTDDLIRLVATLPC